MSEDFHDSLRNPEAFFNMEEIWEVVDNYVFSIRNVSEEELRRFIVQDVLAVTMWEKHFGRPIHFGMSKLMRFLNRDLYKRVWAAVRHEEIASLLKITRTDTGSEIRICDDRAILQAAMDYAGVWYSGYVMPETGVFRINRDALNLAAEAHGGFDNLASSIAMDVRAALAEVPVSLEDRTAVRATDPQEAQTKYH